MTSFTRGWQDKLLKQGDQYIASRRPEGVSDGDSEELVLRNTSEEEVMYVEAITTKNNEGKAYVDATKNLNVDSSGTSADVEDMRVDTEETVSGFEAEYNGSYSGGSTFALDLLTGTSGGGGGPSSARTGGSTISSAFLLAPGENLRFSITNESGTSSDMLLEAVVAVAKE